MKLWGKIVIGVQLLIILFLSIIARINAAEAEKQTIEAQMQANFARQAQQEAGKQAQLAAEAMAMAHKAQHEALAQAELARTELENCLTNR